MVVVSGLMKVWSCDEMLDVKKFLAAFVWALF